MSMSKGVWEKRHGSKQKNKRGRSCCSCQFPIIAFLVAICIFSIPLLLLTYLFGIVPPVLASDMQLMPDAMSKANRYLKYSENYPLPEDVVIDDELKEFSSSLGYNTDFDKYHPIRSCISAADINSIGRAELCALLDTVDTGWRGETEVESFVSAMGTARWLNGLGYNSDEPLDFELDEDGNVVCNNETCKAVWDFYNHTTELFLQYPQNIDKWRIVEDTYVYKPTDEDYKRWPDLVFKFWSLEHMNYGDIIDEKGIPVIIGPGPDNPLPDLPDGAFVHPVPGGCVSGYRFNPAHKATDYSCSPDGWARAAHNGTVVASVWSDYGYGYMTFINGKLDDGTNVCSLYAHGAQLYLRPGQEVRAGDGVFVIGSTGNSTGPHLHFELKIGGSEPWCSGGRYVNPEAVLPPQ